MRASYAKAKEMVSAAKDGIYLLIKAAIHIDDKKTTDELMDMLNEFESLADVLLGHLRIQSVDPSFFFRRTKDQGPRRTKYSIYRMYDGNRRLLYVGISKGPIGRIKEHRSQLWINEVYGIIVQDCADTKEEALALEAKVIKEERPKYNRHHNHGNPGNRI